jgi:uncharacterized membrane protein HdeD (DUF308 family)
MAQDMAQSIAGQPLNLGHWWAWLLRGIAGILFGIIAFVWPGITLASLVLLFGAYALVDGVIHLVATFRRRVSEPRWLLALEGIVGIAAGILTFLWPAITAIALTYLIGAWALVGGALRLGLMIGARRRFRINGWLVAGSIFSMIFGILVLTMPLVGALAIAIWVGAYTLVLGVLMIGLAFRLRRSGPTLERRQTPGVDEKMAA